MNIRLPEIIMNFYMNIIFNFAMANIHQRNAKFYSKCMFIKTAKQLSRKDYLLKVEEKKGVKVVVRVQEKKRIRVG